MKAKRISQKAVKSNTALLHIGKRTNLKRAVSECVYTSRLYYPLTRGRPTLLSVRPSNFRSIKRITNN